MRISIHPEDLDKAWDIIYPLFEKHITPFKVVNHSIIEKCRRERQKDLANLLKKYVGFINDYHSNYFSHNMLRDIYSETAINIATYHYSEWRFLAFFQRCYQQSVIYINSLIQTKENLFKLTKTQYEYLIENKKQKSSDSSRFSDGMQFTIYLLPGSENTHQMMLEQIEELLIRKDIRPGIIYPTDRQIGLFSSIRHPGKHLYHHATKVNNYNPDDINDPFDYLSTVHRSDIVQIEKSSTVLRSTSIDKNITKRGFFTPRLEEETLKKPEDLQDKSSEISLTFN